MKYLGYLGILFIFGFWLFALMAPVIGAILLVIYTYEPSTISNIIQLAP